MGRLTHCKINPSNKTLDFGSSCGVGKSHRLSYSPSETVYNSPFELIFGDFWGPSHIPSTKGYLYYVSFVDAFSRFTWLFPLKFKFETLTVFQNFKSMVEKQFNTEIKGEEGSVISGPLPHFLPPIASHTLSYLSSYSPPKWSC